MLQVRQGDVYLVEVGMMPTGCSDVPREDGQIVLAHGEATGHVHAIAAPLARLRQARDGQMFLSLEAPAVLTHQEHNPITLPPGHYRVIRQRQYAPEETSHVLD